VITQEVPSSAPAEFFVTAGLFLGLFAAVAVIAMLVAWLTGLPRQRRERREEARRHETLGG